MFIFRKRIGAIGSICSLSAAALAMPAMAADIFNVPGDAPTIQAAIDLAADGDTVLVQPGLYEEVIDFAGKTIVVQSTDGPDATIIDGTGNVQSVVTVEGSGAGTELIGFTLTGGNGVDREPSLRSEQKGTSHRSADPGNGGIAEGAGAGTPLPGGGLRIVEASLLVEDCIIRDNHRPLDSGPPSGGGFSVIAPEQVTFRNCTIRNNSAVFGGGGAVTAGEILVENCTFRENTAQRGAGLFAFGVEKSTMATVIGCTFKENETTFIDSIHGMPSGGGVLILGNQVAASLEESEFLDNVASVGGAIATAGIVSGPPIFVEQCIFERNTAVAFNFSDTTLGGAGGAISALGPLHLDQCSFISNSTEGADPSQSTVSGGGAIALIQRSDSEFVACTFHENTSPTHGGAVLAIEDVLSASLTMSDCTFTLNEADSGGAMYLKDLRMDAYDCDFEQNTSHRSGGAVHWVLDHSFPSALTNCAFRENTVTAGDGMGGGITLVAGDQSDDVEADLTDCMFEENAAANGGAVMLLVDEGDFDQPAQFVNCTFLSNFAVQAGAVHVNGTGAHLRQCALISNVADDSGGAVFMTNAWLQVEHSEFNGNSATLGGGMAGVGENDSSINYTTFAGNKATEDGGAMYNAGDVLHGDFTGNNAGLRGGAMFIDATPTVRVATFTGNTAGQSGGAIFSAGDGPGLLSVEACANNPDNIAGPFDDLGGNVIDETCSSGSTIHVPQDYAMIQAAIHAAASGDEIIVGPGTYFEAIDFLGKRLVLRSSDGPDATIIDATGTGARAVTVTSFEGAGTTLEGFTITGGHAGADDGGGVLVQGAELAIVNCIVTGNSAHHGGGVASGEVSSHITITNSIISENTAEAGGGLAADEAFVQALDTVFDSNDATASVGGGLRVHHALVLCEDCEFRNNNSSNSSGGGGVHAFVQNAIHGFQAADSLFCNNEPHHVVSGSQWLGDLGGNVFADDCDAVGDMNGDGEVNVSDLLILLGSWGECTDPNDCPEDLTGDGVVNVSDLLLLLSNWGASA